MSEAYFLQTQKRIGELQAELDQAREREEALRELAGYVRAHLAGNDADPELKWALEKADVALQAVIPERDEH